MLSQKPMGDNLHFFFKVLNFFIGFIHMGGHKYE